MTARSSHLGQFADLVEREPFWYLIGGAQKVLERDKALLHLRLDKSAMRPLDFCHGVVFVSGSVGEL